VPEYENGMAVTEGEKVGTIVQIDSFGLAAVKTEGDGRIYPFTFDKIRRRRQDQGCRDTAQGGLSACRIMSQSALDPRHAKSNGTSWHPAMPIPAKVRKLRILSKHR
jgi:hypothetical protein